MRTDLCSVTQDGRRTISYMSVAVGLMADLDIKTEHLRWMGDTRFVYGFLRGSTSVYLFRIATPRVTSLHFVVFRQRPCPIRISLKVSERDKHKMHKTYQATWREQADTETCWDGLPSSEKLPPLRCSETDTDGWEDFDVPILYFYGGLLPYPSR